MRFGLVILVPTVVVKEKRVAAPSNGLHQLFLSQNAGNPTEENVLAGTRGFDFSQLIEAK